MCSSGYVKVFLWNREWFFSRRVKFDSWFNVMAVYEVSWHGPKIISCFTGIWIWVLRWWRWRPFWFSKKISMIFSSISVLLYQGGCSQFLIFSNKFYMSICDWKYEFSIWEGNITSFALSLFLSRFPMRPSFPTPQCLQPLCHPSKFHPRTNRIRGTIQVRLSFTIDGFLSGLLQK